MKIIPIGTDDFKSLRATSYYVDHTQIIEDLEKIAPTVPVLYLRPRRFGKSLCLSMLKAFYEANEEEKQRLFGDLSIGKNSTLMAKKAVPVIFLRLNEIKSPNISELKNDLAIAIADEYRRFFQDGSFSDLGTLDADYIRRAMSSSLSEAELKTSVRRLCEILQRKHGVRPYLLIDGYDAPTSFAEEKGYGEEATLFFKPFYGNTLKGNPFIEKAIVTGILKFSNISLLSDLNSPIVDTGIDSPFKERFAFSYDEVRELLKYYGKESSFDEIISWYGGYRYGNGDYANPWSVLSYLLYRGQVKPYWTSTASSGGLLKIAKGVEELTGPLQALFNDDDIPVVNPADNGEYGKGTIDSLFVFLLYSGYLAVKEYTDYGSVRVGFPNEETRRIFAPEVIERLQGKSVASALFRCADSFYRGDETMIGQTFKTLISGLSFSEFPSEEAYKTMVLTLTSLMSQKHIVKAEVNAGIGRCNIQISPTNENGFGAVIELKCLKSRTTEERLKDSADSALRQIQSHVYCEELKRRKCKRLFAFGMSFYKKNVVISKKQILP